jgi:hypothetical protein
MVAALFALVTPNVFLGAQFQRYVLWAFPGFLALTAAGLGHATTWAIRDPRRERATFRAVAIVWVGLGALATLRVAALYGEFAGDVYRRDVATAHWIRRNLPPGTAMANLATSVEYLTGHRSLNLHGVTTPDFFGGHAAEREADTFEGLRRLAPASRPPYLITTVSAQDRFPIMRELVTAPPLFRSASFGDEIEIYRTSYDLLDRGKDPALSTTAGLIGTRALVDRLNVCDSREESDHAYSFHSSTGALRLWGAVRMDGYPGGAAPIADGGRAILGGESSDLRRGGPRPPRRAAHGPRHRREPAAGLGTPARGARVPGGRAQHRHRRADGGARDVSHPARLERTRGPDHGKPRAGAAAPAGGERTLRVVPVLVLPVGAGVSRAPTRMLP